MPKPEINFTYSKPYNHAIQLWMGKPENYPAEETLAAFRDSLDSAWQRHGTSILEIMSQKLQAPWVTNNYPCYVIGARKSFSNPLTIGYKQEFEQAFETLVHELCHCFMAQPDPRFQAAWQLFIQEYAHETPVTHYHIFVHALWKHVLLVLGKPERVVLDIEACQAHEDYRRAWEIVAQEGEEAILSRYSDLFLAQ